jgi:hypothetical protein
MLTACNSAATSASVVVSVRAAIPAAREWTERSGELWRGGRTRRVGA